MVTSVNSLNYLNNPMSQMLSYPFWTHVETVAQRGSVTHADHTAGKQKTWDLTPGNLAPEPTPFVCQRHWMVTKAADTPALTEGPWGRLTPHKETNMLTVNHAAF